jgi:type IV secretory pathway VirB4 component
MMNLAEYRKKPQSLADFLPWAALVASGVVLNKDGSLQRTARFRGPDLDSATPAELVGTSGRLNNALRRLGSGWAIFVEASRDAAQNYPLSDFPDPVSALVDAERRAQFEEQGAHFESAYCLPENEIPKAQAWYAKTFGGKIGTRNNQRPERQDVVQRTVVDLPGVQLRTAFETFHTVRPVVGAPLSRRGGHLWSGDRGGSS